jgi:hypothetical protein
MPARGGEIQWANFPGSTTRPMSDCTNSRSASVGSHSWTWLCHSAALTKRPWGATLTPASGLILVALPVRRPVFYNPRSFAIFSIAATLWVWVRCAYRIVICMVRCPNTLPISRRLVPWPARYDAHVWRRS